MAPEDRSSVVLPLAVRWQVREFTITAPDGTSMTDRGHFGVFIDRPPQPPAEGLDYFFRREPGCVPMAICLTEEHLADRGIHTTTDTFFVIHGISPRLDVPKSQEDFHEVTVVLLDGLGQRIGESGATVNFRLLRAER